MYFSLFTLWVLTCSPSPQRGEKTQGIWLADVHGKREFDNSDCYWVKNLMAYGMRRELKQIVSILC